MKNISDIRYVPGKIDGFSKVGWTTWLKNEFTETATVELKILSSSEIKQSYWKGMMAKKSFKKYWLSKNDGKITYIPHTSGAQILLKNSKELLNKRSLRKGYDNWVDEIRRVTKKY